METTSCSTSSQEDPTAESAQPWLDGDCSNPIGCAKYGGCRFGCRGAAQQHADTVRNGLICLHYANTLPDCAGCAARAALDALLADHKLAWECADAYCFERDAAKEDVERLTAEVQRMLYEKDEDVQRIVDRAEAAERERDEAREMLADAVMGGQKISARAEAAEALAERRGEALRAIIAIPEPVAYGVPRKIARAALADEGQA